MLHAFKQLKSTQKPLDVKVSSFLPMLIFARLTKILDLLHALGSKPAHLTFSLINSLGVRALLFIPWLTIWMNLAYEPRYFGSSFS